MTLQDLHKFIDENNYSKVFETLADSYDEINDKSTFNQLKKEYKKGMKGIDYEDRLRTFINDLKDILPKNPEETQKAKPEKPSRTINTQNYFENIEKIDKLNIGKKDKDE